MLLRSSFKSLVPRHQGPIYSSVFASMIRFNSTIKKPVVTETPEIKDIFTPEQREAARLARLANLGWLKKLPEKWIPYAEVLRLEKPVGTALLLVPSLWGITMASFAVHASLGTFLYASSLFTVGALIMRGSGCIINDMLDKDLDDKVLRTIERPIASGRISRKQAFAFLASQFTIGLGILLSLPFECFYLGALSLPFISAYPLFKRFTYYPQIMISICFSWGVLLGFPAVGAPLDLWVAGPLAFSNFLWSMSYDSIYAHQDKEFDKEAGVKSTALAWGDKTKPIVHAMVGLQAVSYFTAGFMNGMGVGFYSLGAYAFYRLITKIRNTDLDVPDSCWKFFTDNVKTGLFMWYGILIDYLLQVFF